MINDINDLRELQRGRDSGTTLYFRLRHQVFRISEDRLTPGLPIIELALANVAYHSSMAPVQFLTMAYDLL